MTAHAAGRRLHGSSSPSTPATPARPPWWPPPPTSPRCAPPSAPSASWRPARAGIVADIYLTWDGPARRRRRDGRPAAAACWPRRRCRAGVRRVTMTVAGAQRRGDAPPLHVPPAAGGFAEDRLIRGLHPLIAQRLQLQRLRNFDLTRLPSADEEVYLFRCVAGEPGRRAAGRDGPGARPDPAARRRRPAGRAARRSRTAWPPAWTRSARSRPSARRTSASTPTGSSSTSGRPAS